MGSNGSDGGGDVCVCVHATTEEQLWGLPSSSHTHTHTNPLATKKEWQSGSVLRSIFKEMQLYLFPRLTKLSNSFI